MIKITWRRRVSCEEDKEEEKHDNKDDDHTTIHMSVTS
jgi:hypothetical protein